MTSLEWTLARVCLGRVCMMVCRVSGLGFRVSGLGFRVYGVGLGFRVSGLRSRGPQFGPEQGTRLACNQSIV